MSKVYIYVVDRDLGFAPNPFHGICSLATCKPRIRNTAAIGDWVIGVGGRRLSATGRCIFAMKVTEKVSYNEYWQNSRFNDKKPVRNGSKKMLLGDNIYFKNNDEEWQQAHSHHSLPDGSTNIHNLERDTTSTKVLLSSHFYYFGDSAPLVPREIFKNLSFTNGVGHRVFDYNVSEELINWIESENAESVNLVMSDPFNFDKGEAHYSVHTNRISI